MPAAGLDTYLAAREAAGAHLGKPLKKPHGSGSVLVPRSCAIPRFSWDCLLEKAAGRLTAPKRSRSTSCSVASEGTVGNVEPRWPHHSLLANWPVCSSQGGSTCH